MSVITLGGTPAGCESRDKAKSWSVITLGGTPAGCESRDKAKSWMSVFPLTR
jgi:hypothetical protein